MKNRNITTTSITLLLGLGFFALCPTPKVFGVVPAPDGGYPGFNTAEGTNALKNLSTGAANTAVGWFSLFANTDGSFNTGVGAGTLLFNVGNQSTGEGTENTAVGAAALLLNSTGSENTAVGTAALLNNTEGTDNTATGRAALINNTTGSVNTATGIAALFFNTEGSANTGNGSFALQNNMTGDNNTAIGYGALLANTIGSDNTAIGYRAGWGTATGDNNTAIGRDALTANGGSQNTAIGVQALENNTSGNNTAIGYLAGSNNTSGTQNIALGAFAGLNVSTADNVICIGVSGDDVSNSCYIGNIFGGTLGAGATVIVDNNGHLGTIVSSQRLKDQIKPMDKASEAIFALKPVTFRYQQHIDPKGVPQFGLVAEEVEKVNPDLVVRDKEGKPHSVRYEQVNAMLLNEFLKEHRKNQQQQKEIDALKAELKEQRQLIQKVSDKVEMSKPAPQIVAENP